MGDQVKITVDFMVWGLRDSIKGIGKVFTLDRDLDEKVAETDSSPQHQPLSTLARRRAEKRTPKDQQQHQPSKVSQRILLCCAWNGGVFLLSILLFYGLVLPALQFATNIIFGSTSDAPSALWWWLRPLLSWTFNALWILPLFVLSKIINSLWFQDIADAAYRKSRGRPQLLSSVSKVIADILFSLLLQALFLIQGMLASLLPIGGVGQVVCLLHMCLLYSLYAFEYKWFNMGWEVQKRLSYIETNWPYFVGFGLPLALFTSLSSSHIINGCLFSIAFPLFIISSNEAKPLHHTYDVPIRIFSVVVSLSNIVFKQSIRQGNLSSSGHKTDASSTPTKRVKISPAKQN